MIDSNIPLKNNKQAAITVITVVYNACSTIENSINSVINQNSDLIEFIIIDGGSTDGTLEIIKKYDSKINYWISEPDNGIYDAMNKGVKVAKGDWVYFLGADDTLNNIIENIYPAFESQKIMYGNVIYKTSRHIYDGKFNAVKLLTKNIPHQAIFYPRSVFDKFSFNSKYPYFADYYLNLKCWKDNSLNFKYIPAIIAEYNDTGASSINFDKQFHKDQFFIFMNCMPWYILPYVFIRKIHSLLFKLLGKYE